MQSNTRHIRANSGRRIAIGIAIIVISLFCFLCDVGALGTVGRSVSAFLVGFFGLAEFAYSLLGVVFGVAIVFNLRIRRSPLRILTLIGLFALGVLALQIYSSSPYVIDNNYKQYLLACYYGANTAGGMLYGVLAFLMMKPLTTVGALVVVCVVFFLLAFFACFPFIRKNVVYKAVEKRERDKKTKTSKSQDKKKYQSEASYHDDTHSLYVAEEDVRQPADGYQPLYPNAHVGIEDEQYVPHQYSAKGLAKDILLNPNVSDDTIEKFNTINNPNSALSNPGASYSAVRRAELRNQLGWASRNEINGYSVPRTDSAEDKDISASQTQLFAQQPTEDKIDLRSLRESAQNNYGNGFGYSSFEALKADQIRAFGERSAEPEKVAKPQFESTAYSTPQTMEQLHAEVEKKELVKPTKIVAKPEVVEAKEPSSASTMAGIHGSVMRAITGEKKPEPPKPIKEIEADCYQTSVTEGFDEQAKSESNAFDNAKECTAVEKSDEKEYSSVGYRDDTVKVVQDVTEVKAHSAHSQSTSQVSNVDTTETVKPDWNKIFDAQNGRKAQSTQRVISNINDGKDGDDGVMYQSSFLAQKEAEAVARARKEAPPLSQKEKDHIAIERANKPVRQVSVQKEPSVKAMERKAKQLEKMGEKTERMTQVTIDQSIYQATPRKPYIAPPMSLLEPPMPEIPSTEDVEKKKTAILDTLSFFGVEAEVTDIQRGPTFSLYTLSVIMPRGRSVSSIVQYENDIAMRMEEESVRILAPIPGKNAVGVEVPNKNRRMVRLSEVLESPKFNQAKSASTFVLGKDLYGTDHIADIRDLPHMLVAGATGAGKSCCINSLIISLLYKASPEDVRLILVDPKRVELSVYAGIPHLMLDEIVCDVDKAIRALNWAIAEMNRRISFLEELKFRNIDDYNEDCLKTGNEKLPRIVVIVDELADLMSMGKKSVEDAINRIARLARATGIHLVLATQRPSVDVVSGTIKNNLPSRIAFKVTAGPDSRTILDAGGAEKLLGYGDMFYMTPKNPLPIRMQGAFISNNEVQKVVDFIKQNNESFFDPKVKDAIFKAQEEKSEKDGEKGEGGAKSASSYPPELFKAIEIGMEDTISISYLQRRLGLGFQKAARIFDIMQKDLEILVPDETGKKYRVKFTPDEYEDFRAMLDGKNEEE